ncbi:site-2 protease family protein [Opitutus sp. GAS368]|jgi:Zn-dependent protease|uniref:site-2 protease family protein n=1 Tax=Opitutus sp. GAS368 TaxID=1882749 RepID=UPI0008795E8B|nr:site-2 protease family protein [Opitutus sp. GAS368]SDR98340.1 Zn-dependent protease (includes SpoIVFB) [Opitutus sp. GAS368]
MDPLVLRNGLIYFIILAASLCLRAFAQAWTAHRLGDRTPALEGRLTLNPMPHVDLLGTIVLPLICIFYLQPALDRASLRFFLGWAAPVPINPHNFRNPRTGVLLTQFAGTAFSILLSLVAAVIAGICLRLHNQGPVEIFGVIIIINCSLMVFDCLPLPPLPGGVLLRHLGFMSEETFVHIARWSGLVMLILINIRPVANMISLLVELATIPFSIVMQLVAL